MANEPRLVSTKKAAVWDGAGTTSEAVNLENETLCGLHIPSTFNGTAITFTVAPTFGGTYRTMQVDGSDYSVTVAASKYVALDPANFAGVQFFKIVSGTSEADAESVSLATRPV